MTTDHQARIREIEARLDAQQGDDPLLAPEVVSLPAVYADLRYLLDRVQAQRERIEALEAAVLTFADEADTWRDWTEKDWAYADPHWLVARSILPAPETVET